MNLNNPRLECFRHREILVASACVAAIRLAVNTLLNGSFSPVFLVSARRSRYGTPWPPTTIP
jgi:hypothetical protein